MKRILAVLSVLALVSGCATTAPHTGTMAGIHGAGRAVGTQGSTVGRAHDTIALSTRDADDGAGREARGIPTPQPVREAGMAAHSIPVPQPPIPMPYRGFGGSAARWP
jgi:uncharacterized protein YceK